MDKGSGYVRLYRCLLDWEWFDDADMVQAYVYMIIKANHDPKRWHGIEIDRGQFVTSIGQLAEALNKSPRMVRTIIERLENTGSITKKATNKYTLISVEKYTVYQTDEGKKRQTNDKQTTNKRQTNDNKQTLINTKKNIYSGIVGEFNSVCTSLPKVQKLTPARERALGRLLKEFDPPQVVEGFKAAQASDFCSGRSGKWSASFDWLIKPDNMAKVLEGNYNNEGRTKEEEARQREDAQRRKEERERAAIAQLEKERNRA